MRLQNICSTPLFRKARLFCIFITLFALFIWDVAAADLRRESPVVQAVQKVSDAVVNISSEYEVQASNNPFSRFGQDPLFEYFFRDFYEPGFRRNVKRSSLGSGVIIDGGRGYVLTNAHVITNSGAIHVILKDNREFEAKIVGADSESDLAVLKLTSQEDLPAIEMGDSKDLLIGETVIAIGNPFGFSNTVTTGVISALNRTIQTDDVVYRDFIQTDASINPGNSGGPLLNINGELIGINTAVYVNAQGIGFAIPISKARRIVNDLIKYGEVVQPWIGLSLQNLNEQLRVYLNIDQTNGVLVKGVYSESPAERASIKTGDIILSIDKKPVNSREEYLVALKDTPTGENITLEYLRADRQTEVTIPTTSFPLASALDLAHELYGIRVSETVRRDRGWGQPRYSGGVTITSVASSSHLAGIGAASGDVIHAIDEMTVSNLDDFKEAVVKYRLKNTVVLLLERNGRLYNVTVRLS